VEPSIRQLTGDEVRGRRPALTALLQDAVGTGASLGFLPPLAAREADRYWDSVAAEVADGSRVVLVAAEADGGIVGSAQLELATRANARHRAEVAKVMVRSGARRRGIGRALMLAAEAEARRLGRTTLHLDTRQGDPSEALYRGLGWQVAGAIPAWAESASGGLDATVFYFKLLEP
jgi:GNAT superfamily N-acetyltransferase